MCKNIFSGGRKKSFGSRWELVTMGRNRTLWGWAPVFSGASLLKFFYKSSFFSVCFVSDTSPWKVSPGQLPQARGMNRPTLSDKLHADTLTDGTKHWQKCERTASVKQMGAECGNKEVTKNTKKQQHTHTHTHTLRDLRQALMLKRTQTHS